MAVFEEATTDRWSGVRGLPVPLDEKRMIAVAIAIALCLYIYILKKNQKRVEYVIAAQHGCETVEAAVPYKWPFALDLVKRQYDILFSDHTFERMTPYFDLAGTCCIHLFGVTGYFTTDPENIQAILSTNFEDYSLGSRRLASHPLLGEGIFSQDGSAWKHSRRLIRRQFVRVQNQIPQAFQGQVEDLVLGIAGAAVNGVVDLKPLMFEYTLNTTTMLLFGEPHSSMSTTEREAVREDLDYATFGCGIRVRLADAAFLYNPSRFRKACGAVRAWASFFADKAIRHYEDYGEYAASEKYAFIIDLWKEMRDFKRVRDQLLHVLVAGRDSTASLLSWTFFHLVRNPDVLERLREEISSAPIDTVISREHIRRLSFLRCCLNETLRLYPSLPMNIRFANKPTVLPRGGGPDGKSPVLLGKGAGIVYSAYHLHRREDIYGPDSKVYRPQRWESGELIHKARPGAGYVDFHAGPRLCLGKDFALMEASFAIVRILQAYPNMSLAPGSKNEPVGTERQSYTIGLSPADGVQVALA